MQVKCKGHKIANLGYPLRMVLAIWMFVISDSSAQDDSKDGSLGQTKEILSFFEVNIDSLSVEETPYLIRTAFASGDLNLCIRYFQLAAPFPEIAINNLMTVGARRGDYEFLEFLWQSFKSSVPEDKLTQTAVSTLSNFGFYPAAVRFIEDHVEDSKVSSMLSEEVAAYAFLAGDEDVFFRLIAGTTVAVDLKDLPAKLGERRANIQSIARRRELLGIPNCWDELMRQYRLGECASPEEESVLRELIAAQSGSDDKIRLWFCWGAMAAKAGRGGDAHKALIAASEVLGSDDSKLRIWRPELLYLASVTNDQGFIRGVFKRCVSSAQFCSAVLAAMIETEMRSELIEYLNAIRKPDAEVADVCIDFIRYKKSALLEELLVATSERVRIQLLARLLDR